MFDLIVFSWLSVSAISTDWFHSKRNADGIILYTTGAGEAVAIIEKKIRQSKER